MIGFEVELLPDHDGKYRFSLALMDVTNDLYLLVDEQVTHLGAIDPQDVPLQLLAQVTGALLAQRQEGHR